MVASVAIRQAVGAGAADELACRQGTKALTNDAEGGSAALRPRLFDGVPDMKDAVGGNVDFAPPFADEADAEKAGGNARDVAFADRHIRKSTGGNIEVAQLF